MNYKHHITFYSVIPLSFYRRRATSKRDGFSFFTHLQTTIATCCLELGFSANWVSRVSIETWHDCNTGGKWLPQSYPLRSNLDIGNLFFMKFVLIKMYVENLPEKQWKIGLEYVWNTCSYHDGIHILRRQYFGIFGPLSFSEDSLFIAAYISTWCKSFENISLSLVYLRQIWKQRPSNIFGQN